MAALLEVEALEAFYGQTQVLFGVDLSLEQGSITTILGANGAGKTTALRVLLGLAEPSEGTATVLGGPYTDLEDPARSVGALLDADTYHPWRTARNHLRATAAAASIGRDRVEEVLRLVGLEQAAGRRVGGYSLGMRQRLGLAGALLGDPRILVLDEPTNGLDPEGIRWLRDFLRRYAARGRTVLVSSHNLAEVEQTADDVVIIALGRLRARCTLEELRARSGGTVEVRTSHVAELCGRLAALQIDSTQTGDGRLLISGAAPETVGEVAALGGIPLFGMTTRASDLESLFFELTAPPTGADQ
jgi:ABC-2 type transport system ATP-binding protein